MLTYSIFLKCLPEVTAQLFQLQKPTFQCNNLYFFFLCPTSFLFIFAEHASQPLPQPEEDWDHAELVIRDECNSWSFIPEIQSADHVGKLVNQ